LYSAYKFKRVTKRLIYAHIQTDGQTPNRYIDPHGQTYMSLLASPSSRVNFVSSNLSNKCNNLITYMETAITYKGGRQGGRECEMEMGLCWTVVWSAMVDVATSTA